MVWYWNQFDDNPIEEDEPGGPGRTPDDPNHDPGLDPPGGAAVPPVTPGGVNLASYYPPEVYEDPTYSGPSRPSFNFSPVPLFRAPRFVFNEKFEAPTPESIQNEPGFKFRLGQSTGAVERSAAARGVTRSGGTIQDILARAGDFASQEYNNAFGRALQSYNTRYGTARDVYDREFAASRAEYEPLFQEWSFRSGAERDAAMAQFNQAFQEWLKQQELALGWAGLGVGE